LAALFARPSHKILGVALDRSGSAACCGPRLFSSGEYYQHRRGVRLVQKRQHLLHRDLMYRLVIRARVAPGTTRTWRVRSSKVALVDTEFLARSLTRALARRRARKSD